MKFRVFIDSTKLLIDSFEQEPLFKIVTWPEIQNYYNIPNFHEEVFFDSSKGVWFVPYKYIKYE